MMVLASGWLRTAVLGAGTAIAFVPFVASAQIPPGPPPPVPADVQTCLCLQQSFAALSADMNAKNQAYQAANQQLADLNAQLAQERGSINVNNPDAVAREKALLGRRDAASNSLQPAYTAAAQAVSRYNASVNEYNARCANRPGIPILSPQAPLPFTCPPVR